MQKRDKIRTLIIEDNPSDRMILRAFLIKAGFQTLYEAETGPIAAGKIENARAMREPYDLIFLDWNLPGGSGLDLLKNIQAHRSKHQTKVIVVTGSSEPEVVQEAIKTGAHDF